MYSVSMSIKNTFTFNGCSCVAMLLDKTLSHPMDVSVFGVAMV